VNDYETTNFLRKVKGLYPDAQIQGDWLQVWSRICYRYPFDVMCAALERHAGTSKYKSGPRPAELARLAKEITGGSVGEDKPDTRLDECFWIMCVSREASEGFPKRLGWYLPVITGVGVGSPGQAEAMRENHETMYRGRWEVFGPCSHGQIDETSLQYASRQVKVGSYQRKETA